MWCVFCHFRVFDWAGAHGEEVWWNWLPGGRVGDQEVKGQSGDFSQFSLTSVELVNMNIKMKTIKIYNKYKNINK